MEKQAKPKNKILKFLPKAASSVSFSFQNHPFSPGKHKAFVGKGFSGPIVTMIPAEARTKSKADTFQTQEPTSPKVSCMGQIKHKKSRLVLSSKPKATTPVSESSPSGQVKKHASKFRRIFSMGKPTKKPEHAPKMPDRAPSLGQMKRFASGRDVFASFDWTTQIAPLEADHLRDYYSDEDDETRDSDFEEEDMIIPFSAPITVGGGGGVPLQPRKEINIWSCGKEEP
ncbi:putative sterol-C-methyltransferase family protein [Hibiscus syriacus]|uniref:Sterol-C-methyltransferase family protein n=1 Tax=Hibiscus syriacus TaxID=106335 RepID=A0A6A3DAM9_HIBSY|nr:uncharacterized protein At1g76070-like [Hibiscus syriacus]KAE8736169.1 putative sterol-C-methyltransferase family protein [Hibiscus syriacus]